MFVIGFGGIKEYRSSSIWRNQGEKKINPLFIKTKDHQRLKYLKMQLVERKKLQAKLPLDFNRSEEDQKEFYKSVQRRVNQNPRNSRR